MSSAISQLSAEAKAQLPQHVAIIMDGNGRWAKQRHLPRIEGHRQGAESARVIIRTAGDLGIKYLTLYAFSAENWNRPKDEVDTLMKYLINYLKSETPDLNKNNVRLEAIGQIGSTRKVGQELARGWVDQLVGSLARRAIARLRHVLPDFKLHLRIQPYCSHDYPFFASVSRIASSRGFDPYTAPQACLALT